MPLILGTRVGVCEVLSALGAGGMGGVYRARDSKLERDVVLKILPEHFALIRDPYRRAVAGASVPNSASRPSANVLRHSTTLCPPPPSW